MRSKPAQARVRRASPPSADRGRDSGEGEWEIVTVVETAPAGSTLDLLLRREQTQVLLELAALAAAQDGEPTERSC